MTQEHTPGKGSGTALQTASIMAGKIIAMIATFAMPLFLTRFLSKPEFGLFSQFYIVINFAALIFTLGIQSNLYFFFPKAGDREKKSLVVNTFVFLMLFSVVAIVFVNIPFLGQYLLGDGELSGYTFYVSLGILFVLPVIIIEPLYVARADNLTSFFYPPAVVVSRVLLVIAFALLWKSLVAVFSGIIAAAFFSFLFVMIYSLKGVEKKHFFKFFDPELAKKQLKYSWPFGLAVVLNALARQFDKIICISFLAPAAFATYSIAFYGIPGVEQVYQSLSQVYLIKMTKKYHENRPAEISEIYKNLVTKTYSFSIPAIFLVSLYAKRVIVLFFTDKYMDAVPLFRIYLFSFLIFMLGAGLILRATDNTFKSLKAYFYSSIITLPLTYFLIKYFGMWGGMTGAMVSIILPKSIQLHYEMKLLSSNFFTYFPWRKFLTIALISLAALSPFMMVEHFFDYPNIWVLLFGGIYLIGVSLLEIRYGVFVFDRLAVVQAGRSMAARLGILKRFKSRHYEVPG